MRSFKGYTGVSRKSEYEIKREQEKAKWLNVSDFERKCMSMIHEHTFQIERLEEYKQREVKKDNVSIIETSLNLNIHADLIRVNNATIKRIENELTYHYGQLDYWKDMQKKYKEGDTN